MPPASASSSSRSPPISGARTTYRLRVSDVSKIVCHRLQNSTEEYLVRWKIAGGSTANKSTIYSWHCVSELSKCLHYVQEYIEKLPKSRPNTAFVAIPAGASRKRKFSSDSQAIGSSSSSGNLTPRDWGHVSREPSVISLGSSSSTTSEAAPLQTPTVYNGILQRKEGRIVAKKSDDPAIQRVDARKLPDQSMLKDATQAPVTAAEQAIQAAFQAKLRSVKNTEWENHVDNTAPSLNFTFISDFVLGKGVYRSDADAHVGCENPCRPNMGQNLGCEYPRECACLEYAAVDKDLLKEGDVARYTQYIEDRKTDGFLADSRGLPKRFPYRVSKDRIVPSTLMKFYLEQRYPIYECNLNCDCGPVCKSRVVQKGRKVPLVIFKTSNGRGWGVYCKEHLVKGEFIDTYIGEVLTNEETNRREELAGKDNKASYLYSLDKFCGDDPNNELTKDTCYVVDGQHMGGPTRFINHSCEPNCQQYTVSYNKHDLRIYDLAFFAVQDIPPQTELTFDYMDQDEQELENVARKREAKAADPAYRDKQRCDCGARKCRWYLWE
ncbi:hypothetical protein LTR12_004401 [Friedmanniomyces endolithicus]|nr:hypothetical protein LTR12_004401 [Friedmanniomyces endolithicus]